MTENIIIQIITVLLSIARMMYINISGRLKEKLMKINMEKMNMEKINLSNMTVTLVDILICQIMIRDWIPLKGRKSFNANILIMQKMI